MDMLSEFRQFLLKYDNPPERVDRAIDLMTEFINFLERKSKDINEATSEDFYEFSSFLIQDKKNKESAYETFISYGHFSKNKNLIKWGREVFDGREVMKNFSKRLIEEYGEEFRNEIFEGTDIPPLGLEPKEKPEYTKILINRFVEKEEENSCIEFLAKGLRDPYTEWRKPDRERFIKSKNIDEFLEQKRERFIAGLEKHRDVGTLYFTQEINDEVVEYAKNTPTLEAGIRKGNTLVVTKIPYETINYLNTDDEKMKAYYYCHCPWARETIKDGTSDEIPTVFCNCSGGYYKNYWEIVLDQPVKVDTVKTVLEGDSVCEFIVYLPEEVVKDLD